MSILINRDTRLLIQGITGREGSFHASKCLDYGTHLVAGVTPGKGGELFQNKIPVFNTVNKAVQETGANVSLIFVPPAFAADAIFEATDSSIPLVVCITEGIPVLDSANIVRGLKNSTTRLIGPNCPGLISPGDSCKIGIMPGDIHLPGKVGVVSRSGTLTYEAVVQLTELGIGQSTCVGIGGDLIIGTNFVDILQLFQNDPDTEAIVLIGEIGGTKEQEAADYIKSSLTKPVASLIVGQTAPPGRRMGHAGAIVTGIAGQASEKVKALAEAGAVTIPSPDAIGSTVKDILS